MGEKNLKIAITGNLCNTGCNIAKAFNEKGPQDISMDFLCQSRVFGTGDASDPCSEYPEFKNKRPGWLHIVEEEKVRGRGKVHALLALWHNYLRYKKAFRKYDIVITGTLMCIWGLFCGRRYIVLTTGSDLMETAQQKGLLGDIYRRALKKAEKVIVSGSYLEPFAKKAGLADYWKIPVGITAIPENEIKEQEGKIKILSSSRLDFTAMKERPNSVKGNDVFLKGLSLWQEENTEAKEFPFEVEIVEFGEDIVAAKELVSELGIGDLVKFVPKYSREGIKEKYFETDVQADQFICGGIGINAIEAMAAGNICMVYLGPEAKDFYEGEAPIFNCHTSEDVKDALTKLALMSKEELKKMKEDSRQWVAENFSEEKIVRKLADGLREIG